jgi:hypothetical protein
VQKRNAEMTALASADLLSANDKNAATELYASAGGVAFTLGVTGTVSLNTQIVTSFPEVFTMTAGNLVILEYGLYHFYGTLTAQTSNSSSGGLETWVEEDPNTGVWSVIPQSECYFPVLPLLNSRTSGNFTFTRFSQPNFKYRLRATQLYGSSGLTTVANNCKLGVVRLFKQG